MAKKKPDSRRKKSSTSKKGQDRISGLGLLIVLLFELATAIFVTFLIFVVLNTIIFIYPENLLSFWIITAVFYTVMVIFTLVGLRLQRKG